jgi:hypothetical protein
MIDLKINPLDYVLENNLINDGLWLEFGVFNGRTINKISKYTNNKVFGFDTFTGLPDPWDVSDTKIIEKGYYSYEDFIDKNKNVSKIPEVNENVVLVKGLFSETVKKTIGDYKISFMHIDCDTYNSTVDIFDAVTENVSNGCIIVFDELINYPNYHKHEYLALNEWVNKNNIEYEYIGINGVFYEDIDIILDKKYQKAALRIIKNPKFTK